VRRSPRCSTIAASRKCETPRTLTLSPVGWVRTRWRPNACRVKRGSRDVLQVLAYACRCPEPAAHFRATCIIMNGARGSRSSRCWSGGNCAPSTAEKAERQRGSKSDCEKECEAGNKIARQNAPAYCHPWNGALGAGLGKERHRTSISQHSTNLLDIV